MEQRNAMPARDSRGRIKISENMDKNHKIQLFNGQKVRTAWNADEEKWYFSIGDVVEVLTDSADPKQYIKKMKMRDPELKNNWVQFVPWLNLLVLTVRSVRK